MSVNVLNTTDDFDLLIGTLLLAVNAETEANASHADWSLAAWVDWLKDQGYPITDAIEHFNNQVSTTYQAEFNSLKSELAGRINELKGLSVLFTIIDSQEPVIAESLHQFIEQVISKANKVYRLAGGGHKKAIIGGTALGLIGVMAIGGVSLRRRSSRLNFQKDMEKAATEAVDDMKQELTIKYDKFIDEVTEAAQKRNKKAISIYESLKTKTAESGYMEYSYARLELQPLEHKVGIKLGKSAKNFTISELDLQIESFAKVMSKEAIRLMVKGDLKLAIVANKRFKDSIKKNLIINEGYKEVDVEGGGKRYLEVHPSLIGGPTFSTYKLDDEEFDRFVKPAKKLAEQRINNFFLEKYKTITKEALESARSNGGDKIEVSFGEVYQEFRADVNSGIKRIRNDEKKIMRKEEEWIEPNHTTKTKRSVFKDVRYMEKQINEIKGNLKKLPMQTIKEVDGLEEDIEADAKSDGKAMAKDIGDSIGSLEDAM